MKMDITSQAEKANLKCKWLWNEYKKILSVASVQSICPSQHTFYSFLLSVQKSSRYQYKNVCNWKNTEFKSQTFTIVSVLLHNKGYISKGQKTLKVIEMKLNEMKCWESTLKQCSMRQIQETAYWFLLFNLYWNHRRRRRRRSRERVVVLREQIA